MDSINLLSIHFFKILYDIQTRLCTFFEIILRPGIKKIALSL